MAKKKKGADLAAAKQAKQKKIAIGGLVVLLAVMAFSVPKTLKMLKGPQPVAEATQTAPTPAPATPATPATPTDPGAAAPLPEAAAVELVDTGSMPQAGEGQFISFERFASKDPFAQQVDPAAEGAPDVETGPPGDTSEQTDQPDAPGLDPSTPDAPSSPSAPSTPATPTPTTPESAPAEKPKSAVISINGTQETVESGAAFPKEEEIFELVSLTATSAKIGIAGGSEKGKKVTLQNTADGTQYDLILVSTS
jgi:hypothetical protein